MRFAPRVMLVVALAAGTFAAVATGALASTQPASGQFVEGKEHLLDERLVGVDWWYTITRNVKFIGTYNGQADFTELVIIGPDGTTDLYGVMEFSGKVCGTKTNLTFQIVGHGNQATTIDGTYRVYGTGTQAGAALGQGSFTGTPGTGGVYTGSASCD